MKNKGIVNLIVKCIVFFVPETKGFALKRLLYRLSGCKIGRGVEICSSAKIFNLGTLIIGDNVWIGQESVLSCNRGSSITIENYAKIGMRVIVVTGFHEITPYGNSIEGKGTSSNILIGKGSAISTMSIILPGRTIGQMSHVAAGSVVTKNVDEYVRVAGVPAKKIKNLK
jgi:acetyltransferase-like isoleucine patch superfamily enzyme